MTNKFKVGDKVRVTRQTASYYGKIGTVNALIPSFDDDTKYSVGFNPWDSQQFCEAVLERYGARIEGEKIEQEYIKVGDTLEVSLMLGDLEIVRKGTVAKIAGSRLKQCVTEKGKILLATHWDKAEVVLIKAAPEVHPVDAAKKGESFQLYGGDYAYDYTYTKHLDDLWILDRFEPGSKDLYKSVISPADQVKNDWNAHRDYNGAVRTEIGLSA
jgi:hypothetical protein